MTFWWVFACVAGVLMGVLLWLAWRWLASTWETLDDEQLEAKLAARSEPRPILGGWWRVREWFAPKPPQLFYRRDKLGRFRKIKRW